MLLLKNWFRILPISLSIWITYGCGSSLDQSSSKSASRKVTQALQEDMVELFVQSRAFDAASPLVQKLYQEQPKNPKPAYLMGIILREKGVFSESERYFLEALKKDHRHAKTYDALGILYGVQGLLKRSIQSHKQAVSLESKNPKFWNNYGFALGLNRQFKQAIMAYQKSLSIAPNEQRTFVNIAFIYGAIGQDQEAKHYLSQVLNQAEVHFNLGVIQENRNEFSIALKSYQTAVHAYPEFDLAKEAINRLQNQSRESREVD